LTILTGIPQEYKDVNGQLDRLRPLVMTLISKLTKESKDPEEIRRRNELKGFVSVFNQLFHSS